MTTTLAEVKAKIQSLTDDERRALLADLIAELDEQIEDPADPSIEAAWLAEAQRRLQEVDEGLVETVPGDQAFVEARASLRR